MIIELMLLLVAVGAGIVFVAWSNSRRRRQEIFQRREVEDSTGKLKSELERTANEIIGRMENHVTHLENILDESERNRTQLEGRVAELKKLLKKSEGQSGEIRDLLARLDDAGTEINNIQHKMDTVERKINLAMSAPMPMQQPLMPQMMTPPLQQMPTMTPPPLQQMTPPAPMMTPPPIPKVPMTQVTPPPTPINPLGPITVPKIVPTPTTPPPAQDFDKILEESLAEPPKPEPPPRSSIVLASESKKPVKIVEADPVKIESTRRKLTEASAELAKQPPEEPPVEQEQPPQKKRRTKKTARDVRKAALDAIKAAEEVSAVPPQPAKKIVVEPVEEPPKKIIPTPPQTTPQIPLKLETTDASAVKEMLLAGKSIEDISRETGLGRGAIELIQEMTRRQLNRR